MPRGLGVTRYGLAVIVALATALATSACGSSSSDSGGAQALLRQTFTGTHMIKSGVLGFELSLTPSGSSTIATPITIGLSGPFQSRGTGQLPASKLGLSINALGHHGALGVISTGTAGYVTLDGAAYQLPTAAFQKLASSFSGATGTSGTGGLSKLGIDPLHWLTNPSVVGTESMGGASTTHIRAHVNVNALLGDLTTFLGKASASGATGTAALPNTLSPATRQHIAATVRNPIVDVWTGTSDKTLRKLAVNLNVPVTGRISSLLGGLSSAGVGLTIQYANLNQPQVIAAPTTLQPFSGFTAKLRQIVGAVRSALGSKLLGSASGSSSSGAQGSAPTATSSSGLSRYSQCLARAGGKIAEAQKCAPLLNGG